MDDSKLGEEPRWNRPSLSVVYFAYVENEQTIDALQRLFGWLVTPAAFDVRVGDINAEERSWLRAPEARRLVLQSIASLRSKLERKTVKGPTGSKEQVVLPTPSTKGVEFLLAFDGQDFLEVLASALTDTNDDELKELLDHAKSTSLPRLVTIELDWAALHNGMDSLISITLSLWGYLPESAMLTPPRLIPDKITPENLSPNEAVRILKKNYRDIHYRAFSRLVSKSGVGIAGDLLDEELSPIQIHPAFFFSVHARPNDWVAVPHDYLDPELGAFFEELCGPGELSASIIRGDSLVLRRTHLTQLSSGTEVLRPAHLIVPTVRLDSQVSRRHFTDGLSAIPFNLGYVERWLYHELSGDLESLARIATGKKSLESEDLTPLRFTVDRAKSSIRLDLIYAGQILAQHTIDSLPGFRSVGDAILRGSPIVERVLFHAERLEGQFLIIQDAHRVRTAEDTERAVLYLILAEIWVAVILAIVEEVGGPGPISPISRTIGFKILVGLVPSVLIAVWWFLWAKRRGVLPPDSRRDGGRAQLPKPAPANPSVTAKEGAANPHSGGGLGSEIVEETHTTDAR